MKPRMLTSSATISSLPSAVSTQGASWKREWLSIKSPSFIMQ